MATAAAVSASCVSDRWIVTSFRCSAIAPVSRTFGPAPHIGDDLDVAVDALGQHRPLGEPRARPRLDDRLLGRPPRGQMPRSRRALVGGIAPLTWGERLGEHRARLVDLLGEVGDGDQIDPHPDYRHDRRYRTPMRAHIQIVVAEPRRRVEKHLGFLRLLRRVGAESAVGRLLVERPPAGDRRASRC